MNQEITLKLSPQERVFLQEKICFVKNHSTAKAQMPMAVEILKKIMDASFQLWKPAEQLELESLSMDDLDKKYAEARTEMEKMRKEKERRLDRKHLVDENLLIELLFSLGKTVSEIRHILQQGSEYAVYSWYYIEGGKKMVIAKDNEIIWETEFTL